MCINNLIIGLLWFLWLVYHRPGIVVGTYRRSAVYRMEPAKHKWRYCQTLD